MENVAQREMLRNQLKSAYLSPNWYEKVDKMSDKQVWALVVKFKDEGKIK